MEPKILLLTFTAGSYYYLWSRLFAVDSVGKGLTHRAMQYIFRMIMSFDFHAVFSNYLMLRFNSLLCFHQEYEQEEKCFFIVSVV